MTNKEASYNELVARFKKYSFEDNQLENPHDIDGFNFNVVNPWEIWHNDLNAEVMLIGQDFSDTYSLIDNLLHDWEKEKKCNTNKRVIQLFEILGYPIGSIDYAPKEPSKLFFTNVILGIKKSDNVAMSKAVKASWYKKTSEYLNKLIEIVAPKYIIVMGSVAYKALCFTLDIKPEKSLAKAIESSIPTGNNPKIFVIAHCSPLGKISRSEEQQLMDWKNIKQIMNQNK